MWRSLLTLALAAGAGSLAATMILTAFLGGNGAASELRFMIGFSAFTMVFSLPGAMMLVGLQAALAERGLSKLHTNVLVAFFAAVSGSVILSFISPHNAAVGGLYWISTALALISFQRLLSGPREAL
jgi:hypothetical protein